MQFQSDPFTTIVRHAVPRSLRNALGRPGITLSRLRAKWRRLLGNVSEAQVTRDWRVKCHPMCVEEFGVFHGDPDQAQEMESFIRRVTPGMQFLDVGTHWGIFTLAALHFGGPGVYVIGIEASDNAAKVCSDNLSINGFAKRVTLINAACGDSVGELRMLSNGAVGADFFVVPAEERPDTVTVPMVTVDSVVAKHGFTPTHLKVDVEGFEEEVLKGARETLSILRPVLFLELHGHLISQRGREPERVLDLLRTLDYTDWQDLDGKPLDSRALAAVDFKARFVAKHA